MIIAVLIALLRITTNFVIVGADGKDESSWQQASVVYADVMSVDKDQHGDYIVHLKPIATLSGKFDSARDGEIAPLVRIAPKGAMNWSIVEHVPTAGTKVLAYIGNEAHPKDYTPTIPNGPVTFMPGTCGLAEVTGFDDPKVTETIENLRKLRGKQREEAEQKAAEKKKANTKTPLEKQPAK